MDRFHMQLAHGYSHRLLRYAQLKTAVFAAFFLCVICATSAQAQFAGGDGSKDNPWQIATAAQLFALNLYPSRPDKHFVLIADIDLGGANPNGPYWNNGQGWMPIPGGVQFFQSTFDGAGHVIRGLYINRSEMPSIGLFGRLDYGTVRDVHLENVNITGDGYVGALAGNLTSGTVSNSTASGTITASEDAGGLIGFNSGTLINNSANVQVNAENSVGGLVGNNFFRISNSSASGNVTGVTQVGGLVGLNTGTINRSSATGKAASTSFSVGGLAGMNSGSINNSYARGEVSGNAVRVGGLVGGNYSGTLTNCYASGKVTGPPTAGGLIGENAGTVTNCFWDTQTSGLATSSGGMGKTTAQMLNLSTYAGWDFTSVWQLPANAYPVLQPFSDAEVTFEGGNGTQAAPYQIATAQQLDAIREHLNKHFILVEDIDLGSNDPNGPFWDDGQGWKPISGQDSLNASFTGSLNGSGHVITGLYMNRSNQSFNAGLFGWLDGGTLQDVNIIDADVTSNASNFGILVGRNSGIVSNSFASGDITGQSSVGGLVGLNSNILSNSAADARVIGREFVGGLVGSNSGTLSFSTAEGSVNANTTFATGKAAGGLAGVNTGTITTSAAHVVVVHMEDTGGLVGRNSGTISNSFAGGNVTGTTNVGGLAGSNSHTILNTYSFGQVAGTGTTGGLVGTSVANSGLPGIVRDSFWDINTSNINVSGGGTGKSSAQMAQLATYTNWDFQYIWNVPNNTYPTLQPLVEFEGGDGSVTNPWQIATPRQLSAIRNYLDRHFVLVADIDLGGNNPAGPFWNGGLGWDPIGTELLPEGSVRINPFKGSLDGNGHEIRNLYINRPNTLGYVGLFIALEGGVVRDLELVDVNVTGKNFVGAVTGLNEGSLQSIYVTGSVVGANYVGELAGLNYGGLSGTADNPLLLENTHIGIGAYLENVIVGAGNKFEVGQDKSQEFSARLGTNVRFLDNAFIPAEIDLSPVLPQLPWPENPALAAVNLRTDVLVPANSQPVQTILRGIQLLPDYAAAGKEVTQDIASGELTIKTPEFLIDLLPVQVVQVASGQSRGTLFTSAGDVVVVTEKGRAVIAHPLIVNLPFFKQSAQNLGLSATVDAGANIRVASADGNYYFARPYIAVAAPAGTQQGLIGRPLQGLANAVAYSLVFRDDYNRLMEQALVPRPADWPGLKALLELNPNIQDVKIDIRGIISVVIMGKVVTGRMDYLVKANGAAPRNSVAFLSAADLNNDGTFDYMIGYPNGDTQALYIYSM